MKPSEIKNLLESSREFMGRYNLGSKKYQVWKVRHPEDEAFAYEVHLGGNTVASFKHAPSADEINKAVV